MNLTVIKKEDDPIAIRISIGGFKQVGNKGYITYRGNLDLVKLLLANVVDILNQLKQEPEISEDDGKRYA